MMTKERPQVVPGGIDITLDDEQGLLLRVYSGRDDYLKSLDELVYMAVDFDIGRFHNNRELAEKMMRRNMVLAEGQVDEVSGRPKNDIEIPSLTAFIRREDDEEVLFGLSGQRVYLIDTVQEGAMPLLYIAFRIFERDYRGLHYGRVAVQAARVIHKEARWLGHRTGTEIAAYSFSQAIEFEKLFPWRDSFDSDRVAQQLAQGLFQNVGINGSYLNHYGISPADYDEINTSNEVYPRHVPKIHPPTIEFRAAMKRNGFNFTRKDAQYVVGKAA